MRYRPFVEIPNDYYGSAYQHVLNVSFSCSVDQRTPEVVAPFIPVVVRHQLLSFRRNCSRTDLSPDHQREFSWKGHQFLSQHQQQMTNKPIFKINRCKWCKPQIPTNHLNSYLEICEELWRCLNKSSKPPQDPSSKGTFRHIPWELPSASGLSHLQCLFGEATHPGSGWSYEGWNLMNSLLLPSGNFT